jgi:hypothetical protein
MCGNCGELGHVRKHCKQEQAERENTAPEIQCVYCQEVGHRARDCPKERVNPYACKNCKQEGHNAKECPEPRSAEGVECRKCNETGHFSKDVSTASYPRRRKYLQFLLIVHSVPTLPPGPAATATLPSTWPRTATSPRTLTELFAVTAKRLAISPAIARSLRTGPRSSATTVKRWVILSRWVLSHEFMKCHRLTQTALQAAHRRGRWRCWWWLGQRCLWWRHCCCRWW